MDGGDQLMVPFELLEAHEEEDGRVFARWKTIADDGDILEEGDWVTPDQGESSESALDRLVSDVKARRALLNQTPPKSRVRREPRARRSLQIKESHHQNREELYSDHG